MTDKLFHLQPWTPKLQKTAQYVIDQIHQVTPELEVLFMGAAALKLPGKNDIDLDILCQQKDIPKFTQRLITVLGKPKEMKQSLTSWSYILNGFEIDCILSDPATSHVPLQRKIFEALKTNPALLAEYQSLKEACDGLSYEEYEKRKITFFQERILPRKISILQDGPFKL